MDKKPIQLQLNQINYNQGTQFRKDGDPKVQEEYAALMQEGAVFPPVDVVFDGQHYFLWDGFTRYFAATEIGAKEITCNVTKGSLRDAQILACSANKTNGQPRSPQTKRDIIKFLLADEIWGKKTHEKIAAHVGVTHSYVSRVVRETTRPDESENCTSTDTGASDSESPDFNEDEEEATTDVNTKKQSSKKAKTGKKESVVLDHNKKPVPKHLVPIFEGAGKVKAFVNELDDFHNRVKQSIKTDPLLWHFFIATSFSTDIGNLKRQLKAALPYAVCAYCGGSQNKDCQACKGSGFLNELRWNTVPEEMR